MADTVPADDAAPSPAPPPPPPPISPEGADPGQYEMNVAWRAAHGVLPAADDAAQDARDVAARRMQRAVRPDEGRQEGAATRAMGTTGRIIAAAGVDLVKRLVVDPVMTGARLMKDAAEGQRPPDPNLDPEGFRHYVAEAGTAASLGLTGSLPRTVSPARAAVEGARAVDQPALVRPLTAEPPPIGAAKAEPVAAQEGQTVRTAPARSIEEQHAFIRDDVVRQLTRAGIPAEKAHDIAALEVAHYSTWSDWFNGALGSPEEMYRAHGAEIMGPAEKEKPGQLPRDVVEGLDPELRAEYEAEQGRLRGSTQQREGNRPATAVWDGDADTFIHEDAHNWFNDLLKFEKHPAAPGDFKELVRDAREWMGMTADQERPTLAQHEKFARGFQQYVREGKAPTPELTSVFERFRQHLITLYRTITELGKPISEDARRVFDRLLTGEPKREPLKPHEIEKPVEGEGEWWHQEPLYMEYDQLLEELDRMEAERQRQLDEVPDDIKAELERKRAEWSASHEPGK